MSLSEAADNEIRKAKKRARREPESKAQISFMAWANKHPSIALAWHTPNERNPKSQGAFLQAMGVRPGVVDVFIVLWNGTNIALELKAIGGRVSEDQRIFLGILRNCGWKTGVAYSDMEAREFVGKYL